MATLVVCPHCGSNDTAKTANGKLTKALTTTGALVGGAFINMVTGGSFGIIGTNIAIGRSWHQYCCRSCHQAFKVRLGATGYVKEIKRY